MAKHYDFQNPNINIHAMSRRHIDVFNEASEKALSEISKEKLGLIATIGSSKSDFKAYDIDQIICPAISSKPGEALLVAMDYYRILNSLVKDKGYYLALCPKFAFQEFVYELVAQNNSGYDKQIKVHNMFFTDVKNIISVADDDFLGKLRPSNFLIQHGSLENLTKRKIIEPSKLESIFTIGEALIGYDNNLADDLAMRIAYKKFCYLVKHNPDNSIFPEEINSMKNQHQVADITRRFILEQDKLFSK